jgi:glycosyltransferase involved in cell wall biosynthesis
MTVVLITTSYPETGDGSEAAGSFVADFADQLSRHTEVTVVAPGSRSSHEDHGSLVVDRFAASKLPLSLLKPYNPTHLLPILSTLRRGREAVFRAVDRRPPDHILALWALPSGYWARQVTRDTSIPYSTWALGSDIWSLGRVPVVRGVLRRVLRDAEYRFADGYRLAEDVTNVCGRTCGFLPSVRRLPAVERRRRAAAPPYRLAFLGRWHRNKGADLLMEALDTLADEDWQRIEEVCIAGGGPLEPQVHTAVKKLHSAGRPVSVNGFLNREQAAELLAWTDYLLIPSRIESIPVIFSDAVQAGCAIVTTPVGDLARLLNEYPVGILAANPTIAAMADGIRRALATDPTRFSPGLAAARRNFSVERAVSTFLGTVGR